MPSCPGSHFSSLQAGRHRRRRCGQLQQMNERASLGRKRTFAMEAKNRVQGLFGGGLGGFWGILLLSQRDRGHFQHRGHVQGSAKRLRPGLVKFVAAVAYHFCPSLPAAFTQPGQCLLAESCTFAKFEILCMCFF